MFVVRGNRLGVADSGCADSVFPLHALAPSWNLRMRAAMIAGDIRPRARQTDLRS